MKVGIIGYGKMGKGIFNLFSSLNFEVTVVVRDEIKATNYQNMVDRRLQRALKKGIINEDQFYESSNTLIFSHHLEDLGNCDLVIESIVEDFQEKIAVLQNLESLISPQAIILTNTSSISINELAMNLKNNRRFCGFHFFNPIPLVNIVEIIKWEKVSDKTVNCLIDLAHSIGKNPIVVNDACASGINDVLAYYYIEGLYILEQGLALPSQIDKITYAFSSFGPCESIDIIGIALTTKIMENKFRRSKEGIAKSDLLYQLISQGRLGKDWGKGLYIYHGEIIEEDTPEFYVNAHQKHSYTARLDNKAFISKRLLYSILNGFLYNISQGICSAEELNIGVKEILGMRRGPLTIMESIGTNKVMKEFKLLTKEVGMRFNY